MYQHLTGLRYSWTMPTLRPRVPADDPRIVEIHNAQEAESMPLSLERYRAERAQPADRRQGEVWVAILDDVVVGVGDFAPAWWTGHAGIYEIDVRVDVPSRERGIGTSLYEMLESRLTALEATRLLGWIRPNAEPARRFVARHGFRETDEIIEEYRLHMPEARSDAYPGLEERLRDRGIRITSLAQLGLEDEDFLRSLHRVWADTVDEPPDLAALRDAFPTWQGQVLHSPGLSPGTHWVALDGDRPVGLTFLKRLSDDAAENDYTGVASAYRGQGIAPALKLQAIAWARENGVEWFYTSSEAGNARMISVNVRLGYRPGARKREVARNLR